MHAVFKAALLCIAIIASYHIVTSNTPSKEVWIAWTIALTACSFIDSVAFAKPIKQNANKEENTFIAT